MSEVTFSATSETTQVQPIRKLRTGIQGLDPILEGGFPRGRTILIGGGPGSGKTVLSMEFIYRGAVAGEPGIFVSFEERLNDLRSNAGSMGMDLASLEAAGKLKIMHAELPHEAIRAGEFDIRGLLAILGGHAHQLQAQRIVLDAIDVLMRVFGNPDRERAELYMLHDWLRDREVTTLMTVKTGPEGLQLYPFLDFMADCVIRMDQRMDHQVRTRRLNVVKYRGSSFLSNEHPFVLSSRGVVLMPVSSLSLVQDGSKHRMSSGNERLDQALGGGLFSGTSVLIAGPSGSGKTSLACTFVNAACLRGERTLYVNFEESAESMMSNMRSIGVDLRPALGSGMFHLLSVMPESAGIEEHLLRIFETMDSHGPLHVVVDAISAVQRIGSEQAAFDFLIRLLSKCRQKHATCIYTNQVSGLEQITEISGVGISSLVDTMLALQYVDNGSTLERRLLVVKSRGTVHSMHYHRFGIGDHGILLDETVERALEDSAARNTSKGDL